MAVLTGFKTGGYVTPHPQFMAYDAVAWGGLVTLLRVFTPGFENLFLKFSPVNAVYWSLAIEIQFYFVMAAAVWARGRATALLAVVTVVGAAMIPLHNSYVWGIFLPYFPMFALGFVLFLALEKGYSPRAFFGAKAPWVALLGPLVAIVGFYALLPFGFLVAPSLSFAAVATLVLWFCHGLDPLAEARLPRPLAFVRTILFEVGAMSYSIYLIHLQLMLLVAQIVRQVVHMDRAIFPFVCIAATVPCCYPFYLLCERPFVKPPAPAPAPAAAAVEGPSLSG
jgi:peptidoglycan/LPS O-acetylase OafA/YrhL